MARSGKRSASDVTDWHRLFGTMLKGCLKGRIGTLISSWICRSSNSFSTSWSFAVAKATRPQFYPMVLDHSRRHDQSTP